MTVLDEGAPVVLDQVPGTRHDVDGWKLEDMEWDGASGVAQFEYSKNGETRFEYRSQATVPAHRGWPSRERSQAVLTL